MSGAVKWSINPVSKTKSRRLSLLHVTILSTPTNKYVIQHTLGSDLKSVHILLIPCIYGTQGILLCIHKHNHGSCLDPAEPYHIL
jgi:hypothetical protein